MSDDTEDLCEALLLEADALRERLLAAPPKNQAAMDKNGEAFLARYTYNSNAIEGNTLSLSETALVLQGVPIPSKPMKDHLEAIGHADAYRYVEGLAKSKPPITEELIKDVHSFVLLDKPMERGHFRTCDVVIVGAGHVPPSSDLVPALLRDLLADYSASSLHPIELAAMFHLDFESIHPFIDGNGRTGRLIMNLMLMKENYPPIIIAVANKARYIDCFRSYHADHSPRRMIRLVAECAVQELKSRLAMG